MSRSAESPFGQRDLKSLDLLATHMSVAVENDRLTRRRSSQHSEIIGDLAHALRTPLSSIKGYSSSLLQTDISWSPELRQEFLETIDREADHLNRVIDELLVAVDGVRSDLLLNRSVTTVDTLLGLTQAKLLTSDGWRRGVRFQTLPSQSLVLVDQTRITQVLVYLLRCVAGSTTQETKLLVGVSNSGGQVEVTVGAQEQDARQSGSPGNTAPADTGTAHYQLAPTIDQMDDALMLSVCRNVAEAHGYELEAGKPEAWARMFSFKLPVITPKLDADR